MKRALIVLVIIAVVGAGAGAYYMRRGGSEMTVNTAPVTRGDIVDAVASTGTLQAVTTVLVGSQVSGNISWLGADFNSIVKKGQVIAKLDPALFQASVDQAKANLAKARADVIQAQANVEHSKVEVRDAQQKNTRMQQLFDRQLETQADLDAAKIAVDTANADVQSSQAGEQDQEAVVQQAQANLNQAQVNLDHTVISSPVDGIIIQRSVDVGQTVQASTQAPTLFIIAVDLTKMQVSASIDEADVGRIRPNQRVTFRVDAYPSDTFEGTVSQIRLQPVVVQNVTTYATMVDVPNNDLRLKPGMTANLKVEVSRKADALRVPNAAVRFRPSIDLFAALNEPVPPDAQIGGRGRGGRGGQGGRNGGVAQTTPTPPASASAQQPAQQSPGSSDRPRGRGGRRGNARGGDDAAAKTAPDPSAAISTLFRPKYGEAQSASTIDALFAPLPVIESRGRVWLFIDKQLNAGERASWHHGRAPSLSS